jgi:hypothetical protein
MQRFSSRLATSHLESQVKCITNLAFTGPGVTNIKT